ncbi:short-chain dehydrogenase/reductase SDR [Fervidicoccus fontis Kam940]|uniref:Short-chain dehydrogenase/reductase SDR n=4 Tax=Fervidicoccus fontis TaxID=683846 RepID=I0A2A0_FERFK|nr:short-chain dehydrogenase/reductase SDR [Fervidicoccus fontis Kam940]HEW64136.1 SDR family oxidoreductase [Fervidicoccus fontis]
MGIIVMTKVYVITGGGGGIGKATAKLLAKKGSLLLADIVPEALKKVESELKGEVNGSIETMVTDVSNERDVKELAKKASELGDLGAIVHTAGISPTMADAKRIFDVNLVGTAYVLKHFHNIATSGSVGVMIASMSAYMVPRDTNVSNLLKDPLSQGFSEKLSVIAKSDPGMAYSLSKLGVILLVEDQAEAWAKKGARLVSISPGIIDTTMGRRELEMQPAMRQLLQMTPLSRMGRPEEIANVIEFLVSEKSSYINGTDILVDGGVISSLKKAFLK